MYLHGEEIEQIKKSATGGIVGVFERLAKGLPIFSVGTEVTPTGIPWNLIIGGAVAVAMIVSVPMVLGLFKRRR
jgi:hypothetical protein